jgi:myo-inositol-1(or 4)-monophosphatase
VGVLDRQDVAWVVDCVAALAAEHIGTRFGRVQSASKADGSLLTEADLAMQAALMAVLGERFPGIPVLAEEQDADVQARLIGEAEHGVWCLDPLDGTTNFASGVPLFGVSLALIRQGRVVFGVVHDPVRVESFHALDGAGAWLNGEPLGPVSAPGALGECVAVVDFKRLPGPLATRLAVSPPFRSQRSFGSVALDWCWLAAGRYQLYLHGGQKLWDYAAGQLIAREAGAAVCLGVSVAGDCGFEAALGPRVATGAVTAGLLGRWRTWLLEG